jgi:hypothetical protein
MSHANTFASGLKELNCVSGQATRPRWEIDQRCLRRLPLPVWLTYQVTYLARRTRQVYRCCC